MSKLFKVFVELYELLLTTRPDDRSGRVVSTGSLKIDDLIAVAVTRRSDINPVTMKAAYEILKEVALEEVCNGKQVAFGLSYYGLGVEGVFIGDHPAWNPEKNHLILHAAATAEAREALKAIQVEVLGMAQSGIFINSLTDVVSGEVNSRLTPGGGVNLTGNRFKIVGEDPSVGLYLVNNLSGEENLVPASSILVNDPSKITFIVPTGLWNGDYKVRIVTQYSAGSALLKDPHSYTYQYILAYNI